MANIIVKKYEHFNRAMGKYITSKAHYEKEMAIGGYIPFDKASALAEKTQRDRQKQYEGISKKALRICREAKEMANKDGYIGVQPKLVDAMKEVGVSFYHQLPKHYQEGGFNATEER